MIVKFKALKTFHSYNLHHAVEGETYEVELDQYTFDNWVESGLIKEIKPPKKAVQSDENQ